MLKNSGLSGLQVSDHNRRNRSFPDFATPEKKLKKIYFFTTDFLSLENCLSGLVFAETFLRTS